MAREEAGFDRTLRAGLGRLEEALATGTKLLGGDVAFTLHDTHGFPVELTEELARYVGVEIDRAAFDAAMAEQRERARAAAKASRAGDEAVYRDLLEAEGPTVFVGRGRENDQVPARLVAVLEGTGDHRDSASEPSDPIGRGCRRADRRDLPGPDAVLRRGRGPDRRHGDGRHRDRHADVYDTQYVVPGLLAHKARRGRGPGGSGCGGHHRPARREATA